MKILSLNALKAHGPERLSPSKGENGIAGSFLSRCTETCAFPDKKQGTNPIKPVKRPLKSRDYILARQLQS
jgi:hypothetical protein